MSVGELITGPAVVVTVMGRPAPKGSRNYYAPGRSAPKSKYEKPWTAAVAKAARAAHPEALSPPYRVRIEFTIARPGKPSWLWPTQGDLDKYLRSTLDGLQVGGLIVDDKHVVDLSSRKRFGEVEGALITVAGAR